MTRGFVKTRAFQAELAYELLKLLWAHLAGNARYEPLDQRQPFRQRHRVCVIDELADGRMVEGFGLAACCHSQNLRALKQGSPQWVVLNTRSCQLNNVPGFSPCRAQRWRSGVFSHLLDIGGGGI